MPVRAARKDDLTAVVAVMNAVDVATLGEPDTTEEDIWSGWDESGFDLSADAFVDDKDGSINGYAELYSRSEELFDLDVYIHPDAPDDVGAALLDAALARAAIRAGAGATLATWVPISDRRGRLFAEAGFEPTRQFVRMRFESDQPVDQGPSPEGVTIRTFDPTADAQAVHAVMVAAFSSHVRPMTPSLEKFTEQHLDHPDFDPVYWVVAEADGRTVGALTAFNHGDLGFIRHIGVLDGYRGRGIAGAMIRRTLHVLGAAGQHKVDLGVDLEDDVGAARLYERLGFRTVQQLQLVERRL